MSIDIHSQNKALISKFAASLYDCNPATLRNELGNIFTADCVIHLATPFEKLDGAGELHNVAYAPLLHAIPDLERRDFIRMAGDANGENWVGCCGHYMGIFVNPWLDIPPTQHLVAMRYHEFFRIEDNQVVEMQALWDIPQVMIQADAWAMTPALGVEWIVPSPSLQNGIITSPHDKTEADKSVRLVLDMLTGLGRSTESVEAMQLDHYWHPKMMWYGPAGIGSMRRISGFRNWHQIPFLNAMPNRQSVLENGALFGDGDYVGFTAFPGMKMTISGDGWLGIAPSNQQITMRSLDFWRREGNLLRENWVLVDLLHVYDQLGVDVFARMCELTFARQHRK